MLNAKGPINFGPFAFLKEWFLIIERTNVLLRIRALQSVSIEALTRNYNHSSTMA